MITAPLVCSSRRELSVAACSSSDPRYASRIATYNHLNSLTNESSRSCSSSTTLSSPLLPFSSPLLFSFTSSPPLLFSSPSPPSPPLLQFSLPFTFMVPMK
uniref:Uncharacterized protein n=1 Tax=Hanusia phi TaxID=3032 RepID=A0A7S0I2Q0_9CRYP